MYKRCLAFSVVLFFGLTSVFAEVIFSENFEGNWEDDWYVDNGSWEVGSPTSGPGAVYEGNNCLTTLLAGNYPPNALTKFIKITPIVIPPASSYPCLTFWEWFDFNLHSEYRDHGRVLIKPTESIEWVQLGSNKIMNSSGVWSYTAYDVCDYAGQAVQIALELDVANTYTIYMDDPPDEGFGWSIDNIEIETGVPVFNNPESWENGIGDWYVTNGTWNIGIQNDGNHVLATNYNGYYYPDVLTKVISPEYAVPSADLFPRITFLEWFDFNIHADYRDHGKVLIKPIGSTQWIQLGSNKIMNSGGVWSHTAYDIRTYAGQTVQFAFVLDVANTYAVYMSDPSDEGWGWYIDDVEIVTGPPVFNNPETWESGIGDWYVTNGTWKVSTQTDGNHILAAGYDENYYPDVLSMVISPVYSVPCADMFPRLTFWEAFDFNLHAVS